MSVMSSLDLAITNYLTDDSNFPPEFKNWVVRYISTFPPDTPLSQIIGLASSQTFAIVQTPALIASGTTENALSWGSARKDASAMFSVGAATKLTIKVAGTYQCNVFFDWGTNATGVRTVWLRDSGTTHIAGSSEAANANGCPQSASCLMDFSVGDYIEATGFQNSGGNITPTGFLSAVRVSP